MRVVITGAAGFIGSHLVDRMLLDGHEVTGIDNLFCGSRANLEHVKRELPFEFVRHDVCEPWHVDADVIFHLACPASPVWYQKYPVRTIETAVSGVLNALKAARETGAKLVFTSTSEVYGDALVSPQPESYWGNVNPNGPRAMYDEGKRCGEALCSAWVQQHGTDVRVARLFNVYGSRMATGDGRLIPNLVTQALTGERLTVYGDGSQTRSFCHVEDVVEALVRMADRPFHRLADGGPLPVVNVGNPDERTILSVAHDVLAAAGVPEHLRASLIERRPLPADDPRQRRPDIERAGRVLGWSPTTSYDEGLRRTVAWFKLKLAHEGNYDFAKETR